jgi:hypothetical protein
MTGSGLRFPTTAPKLPAIPRPCAGGPDGRQNRSFLSQRRSVRSVDVEQVEQAPPGRARNFTFTYGTRRTGGQLFDQRQVMRAIQAETGPPPCRPKDKGFQAMTQMEINALEHAGRSAMAWSPEGYDGRIHLGAVLGAMVPAIGILAAAVAMLFVVF